MFDFEALLKPTQGLTDPDDVPDPPEDADSIRGDVWALGGHRLMCGDATDANDVNRLLDDAEPDLMVTDPPYGVNYDSSWRYKAGISTKDGAFGKTVNDDENDWQAAYALFPGSDRLRPGWAVSVFRWRPVGSTPAASSGARSSSGTRGTSSSAAGITTGGMSPAGMPSRRARRRTGRGTGKPQPSGRSTTHGNLKPATRPRSPSSACSGPSIITRATSTIRSSGLAPRLIAGEREGRSVYAVEIEPAYVDVAVTAVGRLHRPESQQSQRKGDMNLLEQKLNPADLDAIKTLVDSDATMEDLRQAATWHAMHARVQRIEEALIRRKDG